MVVLQYPTVLRRDDNDTWLVTFPDFDDAVTFGETPDEALDHAVDALETVIVSRMKHKLDVPTPSPARGRPLVAIPPLIAAKALLYKDCAVTALVGLIFLASCVLARRPLAFYFAQRYGTDGTHDGMANFDAMWDAYPDFRTGMYVISYLWAMLFLIQAAGTALIIHQTSYSTAYDYDQTLPLAATGLGIVGSIAIGRYYAKKGKARGAAASAVPR